MASLAQQFEIPAQMKADLAKAKVVRQPDHYKSRVKTAEEQASSIASLPAPPVLHKNTVILSVASSYEESGDFMESLDSFFRDKTFGMGLEPAQAEELKRLFLLEHKKKVRGMKFEELEALIKDMQR